MIERTVPDEIDKAYADLKTAFLEKGCKIVSEEAPTQMTVKQGSLWGVSPNNAKKTIKTAFSKDGNATKITSSSQVSSDWKNVTIVGCILASVLVGVCLWITIDLTSFMATHKASFWSWIITFNGSADLQVGAAFVGLTKALAVFLSVIIALEVGILFYVKAKVDRFAHDVLFSTGN